MNVRSLIASDRPFDVMLPSANGPSHVDPDVELIPCSVFVSAIRQRLEANESLQDLLVAADRLKVPVSMFGTPPPLPESAVRERLASSPHFVEVLQNRASSATDVAIVPDNVRAKLWMLLLSAYRDFSADHCIDFLEPPKAAVDGAGMMDAGYWSPDPTHANAAYGSLCLESVFHWVRGGHR